jgi:hypothetical protein
MFCGGHGDMLSAKRANFTGILEKCLRAGSIRRLISTCAATCKRSFFQFFIFFLRFTNFYLSLSY